MKTKAYTEDQKEFLFRELMKYKYNHALSFESVGEKIGFSAVHIWRCARPSDALHPSNKMATAIEYFLKHQTKPTSGK